MRNWLSAAVGVGTLALLVGCSGSSSNMQVVDPSGKGPPGGVRQFISLGENLGYAFEAEPIMGHARSMKPVGDAFHRSLYEGYMEHAEYEFGPLNMDYRDAIYEAEKAMVAAQGGTPTPTEMSERVEPSDKADELMQSRARLVSALAAGAPTAHPEEAGKAQAFFDCWMEQQEENFQPKDIAYCRDGFFANLQVIEAKSTQMPEMVSLSTDVLFDFNKSTLRTTYRPELDKVADTLVKDTTVRVLVWGYTDTSGSSEYNQKLSERRAETVAKYLQSKGVSRSRMEVKGWGETHLSIPTPDNTPEQRNRRVELRRR